MKAFDKVSLVVGKIVIFIITFLSCFYTVDLLCTYLKPVLNVAFKWLSANRDYVTLGSFAVIVAVGFILYMLTDDNHFFLKKAKVSKKLDDEDNPDNYSYSVIDLNEEDDAE